jgi:hypothetical protein
MLFTDHRAARLLMEMRVEEALQKGEYPNLLAIASADEQSWLSKRVGQLLYRLGDRLVAVGERFERYGLSRSAPLGGSLGGNR